MASPRAPSLAIPALAALVLAASCAPAASTRAVPPSVPAAMAPATPPRSAPSAVMAAPSAPRPPPPRVNAAMQDEPDGKALSEARLVASSCQDLDQIEKKRIAARIQKMRADVDASFRDWAQAQPGCWAEYRERAEAERRISGGMSLGGSYGYGGLGLSGIGEGGGSSVTVRMAGVAGDGRGAGMPATAKSRSGTNNQVANVDEADIVKTDGRYVYLAMNGALRIVEALSPHVVSSTPIPGSVRELFVEGDRAVVYTSSRAAPPRCTYGYDCQFAGDGTSTRIVVLDVSDRAQPHKVRELELSGSLMAARRVGTVVHTVVADGETAQAEYETWPAELDTCGTVESTVRAKFASLKLENERKIRGSHAHLPTMKDHGAERKLCSGLLRTGFTDGEAFTSVVSFDLADDRLEATATTLQSRPGATFASTDAIYVAVAHRRAGGGRWYSFYPSVDEVSEVHKFHIGSRPSETRYVGSGVVPGHVLSQFAMDEWAGYLRIATTRGKVPDPRVESAVSVLAEGDGGNLARVGAVGKIAPGEDIRAVRFDGDRAYVVTFKKTDPLFVLDLYDPARPSILGELEIPGFSTYLHRIDPDHLLSIGFDADDHGSFAYFDGVILQLFDVRVPTEPKLLHKEKIGTRGSSSAAATDHLAFNYFAEKGRLAIPMTICEGGGDGKNGDVLAFSGLLVYDVSPERGFTRLGGVDHGTHGASCSTWWSKATSTVRRSVFLDDLVYSIATDRLKVQRMSELGKDVAEIALDR